MCTASGLSLAPSTVGTDPSVLIAERREPLLGLSRLPEVARLIQLAKSGGSTCPSCRGIDRAQSKSGSCKRRTAHADDAGRRRPLSKNPYQLLHTKFKSH